jgi:hypothetical protein
MRDEPAAVIYSLIGFENLNGNIVSCIVGMSCHASPIITMDRAGELLPKKPAG